MLGTGATTPDELFAQRDARTMCPDGGVRRSNALCSGIGGEAPLFQIYLTQQFGIGRRNHLERAGDALTDRLFQLRLGGRRCVFQLLRPAFECSAFRGTAAIVIDHRIAQDSIEPGNRRFIRTQPAPGLKRAEIRSLEDVLGEYTIVDAALEKCEKAPAKVEESVERGFGHEESGGRSQCPCRYVF